MIFFFHKATITKESAETKERKASVSSVDEIDGSSRGIVQEKRKRLESGDYNTKTMEDLEYLQEDLHKELAEITEKSLGKRKHKKRSASSHRESRHKERTRSRYQERERGKDSREGDVKAKQKERAKERERDKQRSNENRSDVKREVQEGFLDLNTLDF